MIHTIEIKYEYQMKESIRQLLRDWEMLPENFDSPEALMKFVYQKRSEFGEIVVNQMNEWMSDKEWTENL